MLSPFVQKIEEAAKFLAAVLGLVAIGCGTTPPVPPPPPGVLPYLGPDRLGMAIVPAGTIAVDGDLAEWAALPLIYLDSRWDLISGDLENPLRPDRAVLWIARDDQVLYAAVRVKDEEVANPHTGAELWQGDGLELFLDLRPERAAGDTAVLGATPGCYRLLFAPLSPEGAPQARWHCLPSGSGGPRSLTVASRLLPDGYALELGIPFDQLNGAPAACQSIGLEALIDDVRRLEDGQFSQPVRYRWTGWAVPLSSLAARQHLVRYLRPWHVQRDHSHRFAAAAVFRLGLEPADLQFSFRYAANRADRPADPADWEVPDRDPPPFPEDADSLHIWDDPALGVRLIERELRLTSLMGGRYWLLCQVPTLDGISTDTLRAYYLERREGGIFSLVDRLLDEALLAPALAEHLGLVPRQYHFFDADTAWIELRLWPNGNLLWSLAEQRETSPLGVRLEVSAARPDAMPVWRDSLALGGQSLAFCLPLGGLADGAYRVRGAIVDSTGRAFPLHHALALGVHRGRDGILPARLDTAKTLFTRLLSVANPNRRRFPRDDASHSHARSAWDLQAYQGRIYLGCGDWQDDQGPIDLWSFAPTSLGGKLVVLHELTLDEEVAERFAVVNDWLVIPDAEPEDPWDRGALYLKERGEWRRLSTFPGNAHPVDLASLNGRLYATANTPVGGVLYESADQGQTWKSYAADNAGDFEDDQYGELAVLKGDLLVTSHLGAQHLLRFDGQRLERLLVPLFPSIETRGTALQPWRLTEAQGGVYYTFRAWGPEDRPRPLFFLRDMEVGGLLVAPFKDTFVQDIVARGDTVYVLTSGPASELAGQQTGGYVGAVYRSTHPEAWTLIACFATPALARSLEILDGAFYVGLAGQPGEVNPASGQLCRLEPAPKKAPKTGKKKR